MKNEIKVFDYEGANISFDRKGDVVMINATEMSRKFGKNVAEWLRLPSTKEYLSVLETTGKSHSLVVTKEGRNGGTWMDRNVAMEFSRWLSPKFGIWCNDRILELMQNGEVSIKPKSVTTAGAKASMILIDGAKKLLNLSDSAVAAMINKVAKTYDVPVSIDYVESKGVLKSASVLLKQFNVGVKAHAFNIRLQECGILVKNTRPSHKGEKEFWTLTDKGMAYGENLTNPSSPKETQPNYYEDKFGDLLASVCIY